MGKITPRQKSFCYGIARTLGLDTKQIKDFDFEQANNFIQQNIDAFHERKTLENQSKQAPKELINTAKDIVNVKDENKVDETNQDVVDNDLPF